MFAVVFLVLCFVTGFALVIGLVPRVMQRKILTVAGEKARNPFFALFPACFLSGTALLTWMVYILGCTLQNTAHPLVYADMIVMPVALIVSTIVILRARIRVRFRELFRSLRPSTSEMVYFAFSLAVSVVLMIAGFRVIHGQICIAAPVVEDFSLHVNLIRSFSVWEKVPAQFPYFTDSGINYHFMMDFLAGNLELLGLRIDFAYNVPSILAMTAFFCGVYECFFRLCGKRNYCHIVWLLVMFRSSLGVFYFISENSGNLREAFRSNQTYMGKTLCEWWGIYQPNALINQRHLVFGYAMAMFVLSLFLPYLIRGVKERAAMRKKHFPKHDNGAGSFWQRLTAYEREVFQTQSLPRKRSSYLTAVFAGVCLGMCGLFSAHSVIAALIMLFVFAWFSSDQTTYLLTAAIAVFLSGITTSLCMGSMNQFQIRFLKAWALEDASFGAVAKHFWLLLGVTMPILVIWFIRTDNVRRIVLAASVLLFVFAFHVQMTPALMQNHKYMLFAIYWFGMQAGIALCSLITWGKKPAMRLACLVAGLILLVPLTATGVYDCYILLDKCKSEHAYRYDSRPDLMEWIGESDISRDTVFLGPDNLISMMNTCGLQNYYGYPGFVIDAGYDIEEREDIKNRILHAHTESELREAVRECGADYMVVQRRLRLNDAAFNEELISLLYPKVYSRGTGVAEFCIYDLRADQQ